MTTTWADLHNAALAQPRGNERTIVRLMQALAFYKNTYGPEKLADDYVIGPAWLKVASGLLDLLNGDIGRLDGGMIDRAIRELARENGFNEDEL